MKRTFLCRDNVFTDLGVGWGSFAFHSRVTRMVYVICDYGGGDAVEGLSSSRRLEQILGEY